MNNQLPNYYCGTDFACNENNEASCFLYDDGQNFQVTLDKPVNAIEQLKAVDCPFGTSAGFLEVLVGRLPGILASPSLDTRATERWLRDHVKNYNSVQLWKNEARIRFPNQIYFKTTSHVQPTVALRIVPKFLHWLLTEKAGLNQEMDGLDFLQMMRKGKGAIVEAHPRMFLYSAIEKQHLSDANGVDLEVLFHAASYKKKGQDGIDHRQYVYKFLSDNNGWLCPFEHTLPADPPRVIFESDHYFDAFLCALTAWAHSKNLTIPWDHTNGNVTEASVFHEGHILVLSTSQKNEQTNA